MSFTSRCASDGETVLSKIGLTTDPTGYNTLWPRNASLTVLAMRLVDTVKFAATKPGVPLAVTAKLRSLLERWWHRDQPPGTQAQLRANEQRVNNTPPLRLHADGLESG